MYDEQCFGIDASSVTNFSFSAIEFSVIGRYTVPHKVDRQLFRSTAVRGNLASMHAHTTHVDNGEARKRE
jgi:hypothetical protein